MSVSSFGKRFSRNSKQSVSGTDTETDAIVKSFEPYRKYFGHYKPEMLMMLQPSTHDRARVALKTLTSSEKKTMPYRYAEKRFADFASKTAGTSTNRFNQALRSVSSTYIQIADLKTEKEFDLNKNVFNPNSQLILGKLEAISEQNKLVNNSRRELQSKQKLQAKGDPSASSKIIEATSELRKNENILRTNLNEFLASEPDRLAMMRKAAEIECEFHRKAMNTFENLVKSITELQNDARANPIQLNSEYENSSILHPNSFESNRQDFYTPTPQFESTARNGTEGILPNGRYYSEFNNNNERKPHCRALYNFAAELDEDLSLTEGDMINLIKKVDEQWFYGECNQKRGHFPASFVEVIVPLP